jgi:hypothetical protein
MVAPVAKPPVTNVSVVNVFCRSARRAIRNAVQHWWHRFGPITRCRRERKPIAGFPAIRARFVQCPFQRLIVDAAAVAM